VPEVGLVKDRMTVKVSVDRNATVAKVKAVFDGCKFEVTGSAKREKGDVFDPSIGRALATARAFRALAAQMDAEAMFSVKVATEDAEVAKLDRERRRIDKALAEPKPLVILAEIREKYGDEAAERALQRRKVRAGTIIAEQISSGFRYKT
jgi:hypothetical protein